MKLMIDISEDVYKYIQQRSTEIQAEGYVLECAVLNGTPLPKGHGRLIDADKLIGKIHGVRSITAVLDAPTIIEADMRESIGEKIRCNTCVNSDDELSGECYECVKGIFDHYETEVENGRTND